MILTRVIQWEARKRTERRHACNYSSCVRSHHVYKDVRISALSFGKYAWYLPRDCFTVIDACYCNTMVIDLFAAVIALDGTESDKAAMWTRQLENEGRRLRSTSYTTCLFLILVIRKFCLGLKKKKIAK